MSGVITPMFLVAGTFFPLDKLPTWVQVLAQLNPLYHTVQLVRAAAFDSWSAVDMLARRLPDRVRAGDVAAGDLADDASAG